MARLPYNPTKANLLQLGEELTFAKDGHRLLDEKKNVLIEQIKKILRTYNEQEKKVIEFYAEFFKAGRKILSSVSEPAIETIAHSLSERGDIKTTTYTFMNIVLSAFSDNSPDPDYSLSTSPALYDSFIKTSQDLFSNLLIMAELETALKKMVEELRKTMRRVNALENIFIPDFQETIKFIEETLEEIEREEMYIQKLVKEIFYE